LALASALPLLPFYFKHFLLASSSFKGEKKKKKEGKKKTIEKEKNAEKGRSFSLSSRSALSFLAPPSTFSFLPFYFKHFLLAFSFSQVEKKNVEKGGSLLLSSRSTLSLLAFASSLLFLPFHFKHFLLGIFFFSSRRKKKTTKKKNHRKEKKCREGTKFTFLLSLLHLG
jgi:hypothetical protein